MKYFGTDGIRMIFSDRLVNLAYKIGVSLGRSYDSILVAKDTRESGTDLVRSFISGAVKGGATVRNGGVLPTPALALATRDGFYKIGVMITASHNPKEYNGIKIFDGEGYKLTEKELLKIENEIDDIPIGAFSSPPPTVSYPKETYIEKICKLQSPEKEIAVLCDCANGATAETAPSVFARNGIKCDFLGLEGNINEGVGVFYADKAVEAKKTTNSDLAFIFDGDGDRIIAVDEENEILDGDVILYILAKWLKAQNKLLQNIVVGTSYSSLALEESLKEQDITLLRTEVGDKYIAEKMRRGFFTLGGESSGHIIFNSTTGDGVKTALLLTHLASITPLCERKKGYIKIYRKEINFLYCKELWNSLSEKVKLFKKNNADGTRIILRKSGTEPIIRLLIETKNKNELEKLENMYKNG